MTSRIYSLMAKPQSNINTDAQRAPARYISLNDIEKDLNNLIQVNALQQKLNDLKARLDDKMKPLNHILIKINDQRKQIARIEQADNVEQREIAPQQSNEQSQQINGVTLAVSTIKTIQETINSGKNIDTNAITSQLDNIEKTINFIQSIIDQQSAKLEKSQDLIYAISLQQQIEHHPQTIKIIGLLVATLIGWKAKEHLQNYI